MSNGLSLESFESFLKANTLRKGVSRPDPDAFASQAGTGTARRRPSLPTGSSSSSSSSSSSAEGLLQQAMDFAEKLSAKEEKAKARQQARGGGPRRRRSSSGGGCSSSAITTTSTSAAYRRPGPVKGMTQPQRLLAGGPLLGARQSAGYTKAKASGGAKRAPAGRHKKRAGPLSVVEKNEGSLPS